MVKLTVAKCLSVSFFFSLFSFSSILGFMGNKAELLKKVNPLKTLRHYITMNIMRDDSDSITDKFFHSLIFKRLRLI